MNLKSILIATSLFVFATANTAAFAADIKDEKTAEPTKAEKAQVKKSVNKHSHSQEKNAMPGPKASATEKNESMKNTEKHDMDKHGH